VLDIIAGINGLMRRRIRTTFHAGHHAGPPAPKWTASSGWRGADDYLPTVLLPRAAGGSAHPAAGEMDRRTPSSSRYRSGISRSTHRPASVPRAVRAAASPPASLDLAIDLDAQRRAGAQPG
jgi:hypothetical protein